MPLRGLKSKHMSAKDKRLAVSAAKRAHARSRSFALARASGRLAVFGPNKELKHIPNEITNVAIATDPTAAGSLLTSSQGTGRCMNGTAQGTSDTAERVGKRIVMTGIYARLGLRFEYDNASGPAATTINYRVILFLDRANNSVDKVDGSGVISKSTSINERCMTYRDMNNTDRYKVLYDKFILAKGHSLPYWDSNVNADTWGAAYENTVEIKLPRLNWPVHYSNSTGKTGASIQENALYLMVLCNQDPASYTTPGISRVNGILRVHYKDV